VLTPADFILRRKFKMVFEDLKYIKLAQF
jgi:hypothetical protein